MRKKIAFISLTTLILCSSLWSQIPAGASKSPAAQYVAGQVEKHSKMVAVYTDFGDGVNRYTQRAALNPEGLFIPVMNEKAPSPFGTSSIRIIYPLCLLDWNGFLFMTGKLRQGSIVPEIDFGDVNTGQDLSGAKRLKFKARGENGGERVCFYMGGLANNSSAPFPDTAIKYLNNGEYITLSNEWKDYTIDLTGLDLSRIASGFGWVSNVPENREKRRIVFYLDEIVYEFDTERSEPLFLRSHEPVSLDKEEAFINNFAYIYDNAIAALTLSYAGAYDKACRIADAIVYAANNDRYYTTALLRNAYFNGDPHSYPGWSSVRGKEFALVPGFFSTDHNEWWEDRYGVSINTGNIAWSIIALSEIYRNVPQRVSYRETALQLGDYILENFYSPDNNGGGFYGGYEGWEPSPDNPQPPQKLMYKSTEHAIDLYIAYKWLAEIAYNAADANRYREASIHARNFLFSMYDPARGCFYTGTTTDGKTINKDNLPLDTNTWGILALLGDSDVAHLWNAEKILDFIRKTFEIENEEGFDFNNNRDGVWYEGTAQYAVVLDLLGKADEYEQVMSWLNKAANADGSIVAANKDNVSTGFDVLIATNETESGLKSIPWVYDKRVALGATCWLAFAQMKVNPYKITALSSGNLSVGIAKANVWSSGDCLHINSPSDGMARLFTIDGVMRQTIPVVAGESKMISLSSGYYVVTLNGKAYKIWIGRKRQK